MEDTAHRGILAVWNDRVADIADFYEWWYVKQHLHVGDTARLLATCLHPCLFLCD